YKSRILTERQLDLPREFRIIAQELFGIFATLPKTLRVIRKPGSRLFHNAGLDPQIDELTRLGYALAIHNVELNLLEGRSHLVLDDLHSRLIADRLLTILHRADAANVQTY